MELEMMYVFSEWAQIESKVWVSRVISGFHIVNSNFGFPSVNF